MKSMAQGRDDECRFGIQESVHGKRSDIDVAGAAWDESDLKGLIALSNSSDSSCVFTVCQAETSD